MTIKQLYREYQIPKNLQEHMLRVAALAQIICENWNEDIDSDAVVKACCLHDIAKPMTFDIGKQAQFGMATEDIAKLNKLQKRLKKGYGDDEYKATFGICKEVGCNASTLNIIRRLEWDYTPQLLHENYREGLIFIYCDMRIGPDGILPVQERIHECHARTQSYLLDTYLHYSSLVEPEIVKQVRVDVLSITDQDLYDRFGMLLDTKI